MNSQKYSFDKEKMIISAFIFFMILSVKPLIGQYRGFPKFEAFEVSAADFELNSDHFDPDPVAITLYKKGVLSFRLDYDTDQYFAVFHHNERIKILKEEGLDLANVQVFMANLEQNKLQTIKGATFHLVGDSVTVDRLHYEDIVDDIISDDFKSTSFTLPKVKVGDIIEVEYDQIIDLNYNFPTWFFQSSIPTLYTTLEAEVPNSFRFQIQERGSIPNVYFDKTPINTAIDDGFLYEWGQKDLPGLQKEPYITTLKNYYSQVNFQIDGNYGSSLPLSDWLYFCSSYLFSERHGAQFSGKGVLKRVMKKLKQHEVFSEDTDLDKARFLYKYVQERMKLQEESPLHYTPAKDITIPFENGVGNSADINFIYIHLLRQAKIDAHPVILSTRDNGSVLLDYIMLKDFNNVITAIEDDNGNFILADPSSKFTPFGYLPTRDLNGEGMVLKVKNRHTKVPLKAKLGSINYNMNVNLKDESPTLTVIKTYSGQKIEDILSLLDGVKENDKADWVKEVVFGNKETQLDKFTIKENGSRFTISAVGSMDDFIDKTDDYIYVTACPIPVMTENQFSLTERKLPLEFPYPLSFDVSVQMQLPEGFIPEDLPQPLRMSTKDQRFQFNQLVSYDKMMHMVSFRYQIQINASYITPEDYIEFKDIQNDMVDAFNTPFVLVKEAAEDK